MSGQAQTTQGAPATCRGVKTIFTCLSSAAAAAAASLHQSAARHVVSTRFSHVELHSGGDTPAKVLLGFITDILIR